MVFMSFGHIIINYYTHVQSNISFGVSSHYCPTTNTNLVLNIDFTKLRNPCNVELEYKLFCEKMIWKIGLGILTVYGLDRYNCVLVLNK